MIGKEKIKNIRSLHLKKYRQKYNKFIAEGTKIVSECIAFIPEHIEVIYALPSWIQTLENESDVIKDKLREIDARRLKQISALDTPNEVLAVIKKTQSNFDEMGGDMIYLDGIQLPSNAGAILRIAEWFGIENILVSPTTCDIFSPKCIQSSMGSFMRLKFAILPIEAVKSQFIDHQLIVADAGGNPVAQHQFSHPSILILGNEGRGPSSVSFQLADTIVSINRINAAPFPESLNVSVAAGIICHQWKSSQ
ncbi:MAG: RNA methyltransferase [Bacteroidia bacterium]|nr:RNA methyltransferase [Bacteroidia bacterium]